MTESKIIAVFLVGFVLGLVLAAAALPRPVDSGGLDKDAAGQAAIEKIKDLLASQGLTGKVKNVEPLGEDNYRVEIEIFRGGVSQAVTSVYIDRHGENVFTTLVEPVQPTPQPRIVNVSVDDDPYIGPEDAPVTIIEFSDFQCPFCKRFRDQTLDSLLAAYQGKIRFVYRDFPISRIHPYAMKAAEAANCAGDQGKYWEYHDILFQNQSEWSREGAKMFPVYAEKLGLDLEEFKTCLDTGKYTEEVKKDVADGKAAGVGGTPTFFINGRVLSGAQPLSAFQRIIDSILVE